LMLEHFIKSLVLLTCKYTTYSAIIATG